MTQRKQRTQQRSRQAQQAHQSPPRAAACPAPEQHPAENSERWERKEKREKREKRERKETRERGRERRAAAAAETRAKRRRRPEPTAAPSPVAASAPPGSDRAGAAFDALYTRHAVTLIRQVYLLTGRPRFAREAVEWAFRLAWQRWPEVAVDPDPAGWVRVAAYDYALSPWHRLRPGHRVPERPAREAPETPPDRPDDRALLNALLRLPAPYRRALVLHDGVGLGLYEMAAEVEASTPAAAGRLTHARTWVALRRPELELYELPPVRQGEILHTRFTQLAVAQRVTPTAPRTVRADSERGTRRVTRGAFGVTGLLAAVTGLVLIIAPDGYTPPPEVPVATLPTTVPDADATPGEWAGHDGGPRPGGPGSPEEAVVQNLPPGARLTPEFR
jgi:DNA-directed RNA polymerase specialized sigma24 family protein